MYRRLLPVEEVDLGLEVLVDERLTQLKQGTTGQESSQSVGSRSILADSSGKTKPRVLSRGCVLNPSTPQATNVFLWGLLPWCSLLPSNEKHRSGHERACLAETYAKVASPGRAPLHIQKNPTQCALCLLPAASVPCRRDHLQRANPPPPQHADCRLCVTL